MLMPAWSGAKIAGTQSGSWHPMTRTQPVQRPSFEMHQILLPLWGFQYITTYIWRKLCCSAKLFLNKETDCSKDKGSSHVSGSISHSRACAFSSCRGSATGVLCNQSSISGAKEHTTGFLVHVTSVVPTDLNIDLTVTWLLLCLLLWQITWTLEVLEGVVDPIHFPFPTPSLKRSSVVAFKLPMKSVNWRSLW
jgi:hypothetical protein